MSAYRELGTYRGAAVISGTTPKTVKRVVARRGAATTSAAGGVVPGEHLVIDWGMLGGLHVRATSVPTRPWRYSRNASRPWAGPRSGPRRPGWAA
jgi:hypothetical protein